MNNNENGTNEEEGVKETVFVKVWGDVVNL